MRSLKKLIDGLTAINVPTTRPAPIVHWHYIQMPQAALAAIVFVPPFPVAVRGLWLGKGGVAISFCCFLIANGSAKMNSDNGAGPALGCGIEDADVHP
jgi:hypothetical protein